MADNRTDGPWRVNYSKGGREMPPCRNIPTREEAERQAARLATAGYQVRPVTLDTCG